ncbi:unnamed protein product [Owenia fusiformis]|uniref:TIR domain-containing protein n=1 Tax=Owenia fusiformis TaxID=6347 RepID=A0A8S4Q547_OWEFU|nr:unnamed protein product [Owenia fusiformis]
MKYFSLFNSRVVDIDTESFEYLPYIEEIDLSANSLQMEIDYGNLITLLFSLTKLEIIRLTGNSRNSNSTENHEVFPEKKANRTIDIPRNIEEMHFSFSTLSRGRYSFSYGLNLNRNNSIRVLDFASMKLFGKLGPIHGLVHLTDLYADNMGSEIYPNTISCHNGAFESIEELLISGNSMNMRDHTLNATYEMFVNCPRLRKIDLSYNKMATMPFIMFRNSSQLRTIHLNGNKLKKFNIDLESALHLESLNIADNELQSLPENIQRIIGRQNKDSNVTVRVDLQGNPLICGCNSIDFIAWMQENSKNIMQWEELQCTYFNDSTVKMHTIDLAALKFSCWKPVILAGTIPSGFMLVFGCLAFLVYRRRYKLHYLYLQLRAALRHHGKENNEYDFDAFISYNSLDKTWGQEALYATLVGVHHYKICIDDRNFRPGAYISDIILDAINRSNKVILIITQNFLRSKWCTYEMNIARGELANRGRDCLVLILKEPINVIPKELITPTLQSLLDTRVYLEWSDYVDRQAVFWRKLCDALGEPRPHIEEQGGSQYTMPQNEEDEQAVENFLRENTQLLDAF